MQGLPTNLLTQNVAAAAVKGDANTPVMVNGKLVTPSKESNAESKGAFASIFANLLGNSEVKAEGQKTEGGDIAALLEGSDKSAKNSEGKIVDGKVVKGEAGEASKTAAGPEVKLDALLKNKDQEKNKKTEVTTQTPAQALSPEVLKNINNLLDKTPMAGTKGEVAVDQKVAATTNNLEQLLKSLKSDENVAPIQGEGAESSEGKAPVKAKNGNALDFLLKESKGHDVGSASAESKILQSNPEAVSKLGLSSEDFLSHMSGAKNAKDIKMATPGSTPMNLDGEILDPKAMVQNQMNQSMKNYGQKQNLLSDNIIRGPKDLAVKDSKLKSSIDELKTPDMKIGAELAGIKESFIPVMQKQEQGQQAATQGSEKVLDLSKINTSNTNEIIKRISDYVQQGQVANKDSLDLTVRHDSLGQFKIQVNKPMGAGTQMDMQITTSTAEGHEFFMKNEIGLMKNLSQAGIQLSDLRIVSGGESAGFSGNDSRQSGNSQYGSQAGKEFMSFDSAGDSSHGSDRRKELWQEARNNQQRYGA